MPEMTPELQAAYNEWLLLWGYRAVHYDELQLTDTMLESPHTSYGDWQRCLIYTYETRSYQLRTLEEIKIYDEKQNNS